jgi:hypothetical protein
MPPPNGTFPILSSLNPNILTTSTMSSPLLVVASPLLPRRHLLSISRSATSALRRAATCCLLLLPVASCLPAGCHVPSCRTASTLHHLLLCHHLTCPSSSPRLHLHRPVVASDLAALPPPPVLPSTVPPLNAPLPHIVLATPPPVYLLFPPTGCRVASCGTSASHPLACPLLHLCLLSHLVLIRPS